MRALSKKTADGKPDVLFLSGTLEVGGSESKVVKIANAIARSGYRTQVAYLNLPDTLLGRIETNVEVSYLDRRGKYSAKSLYKLRALLAGRSVIVFSVNFYPLLYVVPCVKLLPPRRGKAICLINTSEFRTDQRILGQVYAPFLRRCDHLVYGCIAQQEVWTRKYRLPVSRSTYIYNGVDTEAFRPDSIGDRIRLLRREWGVPDDAVIVGSVGRLAPEKNYELLIRACQKLRAIGRDTFVVLVGDGKERASLQRVADEEGLHSRVIFPGLLADPRDAVSAMDIFVLPSRAVETFSNAALEAMALARPVVLSGIGGAFEMVEHEKNGFIFEVGDLDGLVGILKTLHDSESLRTSVGAAGRDRAVEQFRFQTMLENYRKLIDSLAGDVKQA